MSLYNLLYCPQHFFKKKSQLFFIKERRFFFENLTSAGYLLPINKGFLIEGKVCLVWSPPPPKYGYGCLCITRHESRAGPSPWPPLIGTEPGLWGWPTWPFWLSIYRRSVGNCHGGEIFTQTGRWTDRPTWLSIAWVVYTESVRRLSGQYHHPFFSPVCRFAIALRCIFNFAAVR